MLDLNAIGELQSPSPHIQWLAVIPLAIAVGRWLGDLLDLIVGPLHGTMEWAKLGAIGGGIFGIAFYVTLVVRA